jgi:predicted PurR-regulated permease PerM
MARDLLCELRRRRLYIITIALLVLVSYLLSPLLDGIVLGVVFAYVGRPVRDLFPERRRLGSLAATVCIAGPLSAIFVLGALEVLNQVRWLEDHRGEILAAAVEFISRVRIPEQIFYEISRGMENILGIGLHLLSSFPVFSLGTAITLGGVNFLISLCVCYFVLLEKKRLAESLMSLLSPESDDFNRRCLARIDSTLSGIYIGSIYTAIAGGVTSIAIFYFFNVPRPFAMACIVFLAGMIPFMTWLVFVPTAVSIYIEHGLENAVLFFLAGSILVHVAELVIRPYIVSAKSSLHPLLVLLSFLGGGIVAGIAGFFLAPAMVGVVMGISQVMWEERVKENEMRKS